MRRGVWYELMKINLATIMSTNNYLQIKDLRKVAEKAIRDCAEDSDPTPAIPNF